AHDPDTGITPASTTKVVTSVAALASLGPDTRLATRVVQGSGPGSVVLVGGGDPLLAGPKAKRTTYPDQASIVTLANRTAAALKRQGVGKVTLTYDASLFTGPATGPGWKPSYIPDGHVAPVHALAIDEGRQVPGQNQPRVADPPRHAADAFAALLRRKGITVAKKIAPGRAPEGAAE